MRCKICAGICNMRDRWRGRGKERTTTEEERWLEKGEKFS